MHECDDCGRACDCDGEDMWNECPTIHHCISEECAGEFEPGEDGPADDIEKGTP